MPPRSTQQQQAPKPDRDPSEPVFNPAVGGDFDARFKAALAKDDATREAEKSKRGTQPASETKPEVSEQPKAEAQPKPEAAPATEQPKVEELTQPKVEEPKKEEKPTVVPEVKRQKTASENFAELRKRTEAAEAEVKRLTQLVQAQKPPATNEDLERIKKENEELHERFAALDLSMDPRFQAHYDGQIAPAVKEARDIVGPEHSDRIQSILEMPQSVQRTKLLAELYVELEPWQAERLREINVHVSNLAREKSTWLGKAKQTRDQLIAQQQQQQQQHIAQAQTLFAEQLKKAENPETGFYGFITGEGNAEEVAKNKSLAQAIFSGQLSMEDLAKASIWAAAAPVFLNKLAEREAEIVSLNDTIAKLKAAGPTPGSGPSAETPKAEQEDPNMPYAERVARRAARSGAFER